MQYNAALVITGAIKGTSKERIYRELGFESLADRRWFRRMCTFWKIVKGISPTYLQTYLPVIQYSRNSTRPYTVLFLAKRITLEIRFFLIL